MYSVLNILSEYYILLHIKNQEPLVHTLFYVFLKSVKAFSVSIEDSENFFMQSLPLYTSCLFSMTLNDNIVDIEKH